MQADVIGPRPRGTPKPRPPAVPPDVVVPVYGNPGAVSACLDALLVTVPPPSRIVVVDDASPDPDVAVVLARAAATGRVTVTRLSRNLGFPGAANAGIAACPGRDVVLLNSDTLVPPGWLERLREAAWGAADIGTVTPLSNSASVLSYPDAADRNPLPTQADTIRLDAHARAANAGLVVDIPVGVGFCLFIRRDCLAEVGVLRADVFAQGYGEENDFCLRARHLGWRHVALPGLFVGHAGGASFGPAGRHLQQRNERLLERMHPGYGALVQDFLARDPLAEARRRLDLQRWQAGRKRAGQAAILISHGQGGGVERQLAAAARAHRDAGRRPIVLRPTKLPDGTTAVMLGDGPEGGFPNLRFRLPDELPALQRLLRADRAKSVDVHHLLGHPPAIHALIAALRLPYTVHVHDYAWFCPRVSLVGADRRYCGEPDVAGCEACIADAGALIEEDIGVQALCDRSAAFLAAAEHVVAPSQDAAVRMRRHFPALRPNVAPHEDDAALPDPPPPAARGGRARICVPGAIGLHKGYHVLLACAHDAAARRLPLEFAVVGHTIGDAALLATGRVFITGEYLPEEAVALIAAQRATLGFLPSIWPETWSLGLTELWRAGLRVAAFAFGAPADRIRMTGRGVLLRVGLSSAEINNALVAACGLSGHEGA
jgi:GT2 family glycosyltransferase